MATVPPALMAAPAFQVLYAPAPSSSGVLFNGITQARDGNFYGTAPGPSGGNGDRLFRLTPAGGFSTLVGFTGPNGDDPEGGLLLATDGCLYGTTLGGGAYGFGTLFRFTVGGRLEILHGFSGPDGVYPVCDLTQGSDGYLYGVTGGSQTNAATVFRATTNGVVTTLTNLNSLVVGSTLSPNGGLVQGPDGWLYGTAVGGGPLNRYAGAIYKVSTNGDPRLLVAFPSPPQPYDTADRPMGGLTSGTDGFLYGVIGHNLGFGPTNDGRVFRLTTNGVMTTVCAFGSTNGSNPMSRLLLAGDGSFYGITAQGGLYGKGTIFRVTTGGDLMSLFDFAATNGTPVSNWTRSLPPLVQGSDGNLYGTSLAMPVPGSSFPVIFRLVEPPTTTVLIRPDGRLTLSWNSFPGGIYRVLYKASIEANGWARLGADVTATGSSASCTDNPTMGAQRYYKIMLLP